jgi:hypothetical protein
MSIDYSVAQLEGRMDKVETLTEDPERGNMALHKRVGVLEKDKVKLAAYVGSAVFVVGLLLKGLDYLLPHIEH